MKLEIQSIDYIKSTSEIFLFCRDSSGKLITYKTRYYPYFFVHRDVNLPQNSGILKIEDGYISAFDEPLKKLTFHTVPQLVERRKILENLGVRTYESRIPFVERWLIDKGIKTGVEIIDSSIKPIEFHTDPRVIWLDIETTTLSIGAEPIDVIGVMDVNKRVIYLLTTIRDEPSIERLTDFQVEIFHLENEWHLLCLFEQLIKEINPDLILGFNITKFDLPFINKRSPRSLRLGRLNRPLTKYGTIWGRTVLDYEEVWFNLMATELRSHSLSGIIDYLELPYQKVKITDWKKTLETDPYLILDRNLRDLELCYLIEQKVGLIELMNAIRRFVGCKWKSTLSKSRIAKILLYREFPDKKFPSGGFKHESYKGAVVIEPKVGIHENVAVIDFKALYPMIILEYNLSPDKYSMLPQIIQKLITLRESFKARMKSASSLEEFEKYKRLQRAIKFCVNACYGMCAYAGSPLFSIEIASQVTANARKCLLEAKQIVEDLGYEVIYGDTDSVFVKVSSLDEAMSLVDQINQQLSKKYKYIRMSLDSYFEKLILLTKKRYSGFSIYEKGKKISPKLVKVGIRRTDISKYASKVMDEVIKLILQDKIQEIPNYLREVKRTLPEVPISEIALPKGLRKELDLYKTRTIFHEAVEYSNTYLGMEIIAGEKPLFLPIKRVPRGYPSISLITIREDTELPDGFELDYDQIYKKYILKPIERFLELVGLSAILKGSYSLDRFILK